jgi:tRNA (guanine26-N2/guanine27-N2)-dimethyltransferase
MAFDTITENTARITLAKGIFYNPRMEQNRTLSSLALGAALPLLTGSRTLDGFCASGIRGIRYALENKLDEITFLDANPAAIKNAKKNVKENKIKHAFFSEDEFNRFAGASKPFDVIDVDPFGTPAPFIQTAIRMSRKKCVLGVTATDLATLCGRKNQPAKRRYDAQPLYVNFAHELALRIVLGYMARQAATYDVGVQPFRPRYGVA